MYFIKTRKKIFKTFRKIDLLEAIVYPEISKIITDENNKFFTFVLQSAAGININENGIKQNILPSGLYRNKNIHIFYIRVLVIKL